jgi:hypothetical protein
MTPEERQAVLDIRRQAISALVLSNRLLGLPDGDRRAIKTRAERRATLTTRTVILTQSDD